MRRKRLAGGRGFTIVELLVVLAIIGILTAIAVPNLLRALDRGRQKRSMADLRTLAQALSAYAVDNDDFPSLSSGSVGRLAPLLAPTYAASIPVADGWGIDYLYQAPAADPSADYLLVSLGRDGLDDSGGWSRGLTHEVDADIVFADGAFIQWPEGVQE